MSTKNKAHLKHTVERNVLMSRGSGSRPRGWKMDQGGMLLCCLGLATCDVEGFGWEDDENHPENVKETAGKGP